MTDSELFDTLCNLLESQFDALLLRAGVPTEYVSPRTVAVATRATELLRWMKQPPGHRPRVLDALAQVQGTPQSAPDAVASVPPPAARTPTPTPQDVPRGTPRHILFLAAEPTDEARLRLGRELEEMRVELRVETARKSVVLDSRWAVRPRDLGAVLHEVAPHIVHFSGHGSRAGRLVLENDAGRATDVAPEALEELFSLFPAIECVVLNACYSEDQAAALARCVPHVVGMRTAISDRAAIVFAVGFYRALAAGRSIPEAHKFGCVELRLMEIPEHLTPVLKTRGAASDPRPAGAAPEPPALRVAVVAVHDELGAYSEAVAQRLRGVAQVEALDAARAESRAALAQADVVAVLLGWRTGGTDVLAAALDATPAFAAHSTTLPADDVPDDEMLAARRLRQRVTRQLSDPERSADEVYAVVAEERHRRAPRPPGRTEVLEAWEADYLRDRLTAWEQGRFGAFADRARRHIERARLYVSLRAAAQPWCHVDKEGKLVVEPGRAERAGRGGPADAEAALGREEREYTAPFTEAALSHPNLPYVVVQGEAGSGKTVLLQHLAYVLAQRHLGQDLPPHELDLFGLAHGAPLLRIPVFVEAKSVAESTPGHDGTLIEAVRGAFGHARQPERATVEAGLEAGRYLVLIDALDEVPTGAGRQHVLQCVAGFARRGWKSRVVLTTRPTAHTGAHLPAGLPVLPLAALDGERIERLVERWCVAHGATASEKHELHAAIGGVRERHAADNIVENPLLLGCLMMVYDQQRLLPDSTADLYERMVGILCELRRSRFTPEQRRHALTIVFHGLQRTGTTERAVREIAAELVEWRRDDLPTLDAAEKFLDELGNDTALLRFEERRDPGGRSVRLVRPWHRSFQEYLSACFLASTRESVARATDRMFAGEGGRPAVVEDPTWEGALTFLVGAYGGDRARAYVERLVEHVQGAGGLALPEREGRVLGLAGTGMMEYPEYFQGHELHRTLPEEIVRRFEARGAAWPWRDRVLALEALGRLGDPRLKREPWVEIPGGRFVMGGDSKAWNSVPRHEVRVGPFRMWRWPVTVGEYEEFVKAGGYGERRFWDVEPEWSEPEEWRQQLRHPNRPVVWVSWYEAMAWCRWATKERAPAGHCITLPAEEEWEYVARGAEGRAFPWGKEEPGEEDAARANYSWGSTRPGRPTPVGAFPRGHCWSVGGEAGAGKELWDLAGNVWEWCWTVWRQGDKAWSHGDKDWSEGDTRCRDVDEGVLGRGLQSQKGQQRQGAAPRVVRGGSWGSDAGALRCARRVRGGPVLRYQLLGFRVVCRRFRQHVGD